MSWLGMMQDEEGVQESAFATLWDDTFTETVDTNIASHITDDGKSYLANKTLNNATLQTAAPGHIVLASSAVLNRNETLTGPVFNIGTTRCKVSFNISNLDTSLNDHRYMIRINPSDLVRKPHLQITRNGLTLYAGNFSSLGSYATTLENSHLIEIYDDGTNAVGGINVYLDGTLRITSSAGDTNTTGTQHAISLTGTGLIDNLLITEW